MTTEKKYFGTDGIRGRVGNDVINPEFMFQLGWAAGSILGREGCNQFIIGTDTRESCDMIESALASGLSAAGIDTLRVGVIPTPGVAYLTRILESVCAGIVVSASHNPHHDNGIKLFDKGGKKLSDEAELAIEQMLSQPVQTIDAAQQGKTQTIEDAATQYADFCKASVPASLSLSGLKIVVDCAHGAAYRIAPRVFSGLGADVVAMGVEPDGVNINQECGATSLSALQSRVIQEQADLGIALDGDADRLIMVDHEGSVVNGDSIIYILARLRHKTGQMRGAVVGTLMSNLGLERAIMDMGLAFIRENVGDRYVIHRLHEEGGILGGESSGHIICLDKTTTGDGIIAALQVLHAMQEEGMSLRDICQGMVTLPQTMINVPLATSLSGSRLADANEIAKVAERQLNGRGRILLRPSGTEPVVRVMVEGDDPALVQRIANEVAAQVEKMLQ